MTRASEVERKTNETDISLKLNLDGQGIHDIATGVPFFDHMLTLFTVHGIFDLSILAKGDLEVDYHHTVEDVGLVLGDAFDKALGDRKGIRRYGHAVIPMDEALTSVTIDLSKRPFLVFNVAEIPAEIGRFSISIAKEFFRAFANRTGMNLHINAFYGENVHHLIESIFKASARAMDDASSFDKRVQGVHSTKGIL
jgi:imidazoleglycerol-phosphate dehydratase